ncbi:Cysteine/Histidine-rich C1 domain family protein [Raphanus sativus]|nr:Cysteine/Histidine-rich C1 domain family protein [Raphanus sativus]
MMYGSYYCNEAYCDYRFHKDCAESPLEINHHPSHPEHSLLLTMISPQEFGTPCDFCGQEIESICYDCPTCKFKVDLICGTKPSPSVIEHPVCHDHTLVFLKKEMKKDRVPCDVCKESISGPSYSCLECNNVYFHLDCVHLSKEVAGIKINSYKSYICLKCDFVVSGSCVGLPSIININRHDHRISFTHHLGRKGAKCGVCREKVSQYYGAYSCSICPKYVVHSLCAANFTAWNGVELEGIPETSEDIVPFKVMGDNLIRHFSHEKHILLLLKDYDMVGDDYERLRCQACVSPIGFGPVYSCQYCRFFLHEKCAYLPLKKNLVFGSSPYKLEYQGKVVYCKLCGIFSGGFKYISLGPSLVLSTIDVRCSSISEPFVYNGHFHPLYFVKTKKKRQCNACGRYPDGYMLTCGACDFDLCLYCATLPERIWHISDEHPLTLNYGGKKAIGKNWCQVCEMKLDSRKWFFTCSDCGVTLHVGCVLGDFSWLDPNCSVSYRGKEHLAILNRQNSRPFCRHCHDRCKAPVILQVNDEHNGYICSRPCLLNMAGYV